MWPDEVRGRPRVFGCNKWKGHRQPNRIGDTVVDLCCENVRAGASVVVLPTAHVEVAGNVVVLICQRETSFALGRHPGLSAHVLSQTGVKDTYERQRTRETEMCDVRHGLDCMSRSISASASYFVILCGLMRQTYCFSASASTALLGLSRIGSSLGLIATA